MHKKHVRILDTCFFFQKNQINLLYILYIICIATNRVSLQTKYPHGYGFVHGTLFYFFLIEWLQIYCFCMLFLVLIEVVLSSLIGSDFFFRVVIFQK